MNSNSLETENNERHEAFARSASNMVYHLPHLGTGQFLQNIRDKARFYGDGSGACGELLANVAALTGVDFGKLVNPSTDLNNLFSEYFKSVGLE